MSVFHNLTDTLFYVLTVENICYSSIYKYFTLYLHCCAKSDKITLLKFTVSSFKVL